MAGANRALVLRVAPRTRGPRRRPSLSAGEQATEQAAGHRTRGLVGHRGCRARSNVEPSGPPSSSPVWPSPPSAPWSAASGEASRKPAARPDRGVGRGATSRCSRRWRQGMASTARPPSAITHGPARAFDVADRIGSVDHAASRQRTVLSGDPLEEEEPGDRHGSWRRRRLILSPRIVCSKPHLNRLTICFSSGASSSLSERPSRSRRCATPSPPAGARGRRGPPSRTASSSDHRCMVAQRPTKKGARSFTLTGTCPPAEACATRPALELRRSPRPCAS